MADPRQPSIAASSITVETAKYLVTDQGALLIAGISNASGDFADRLLALRKRGIDPDIGAGVIEIAAARHRARTRFADADRLFFTSEALAQATSPGVARYHASRLAPLGTIADLGCGIGMDAIAFAEAGAKHVFALDRDPVKLIFAAANAAVRGVADRIDFVESDVTQLNWNADAIYWDPSRRSDGGQRVSNQGDRYEPPLSFLDAIKERAPNGGCVKLSPGLPDNVLSSLGGSVAFLSEGRECKEACLWFGDARRTEDSDRSAVLLPENIVFAGAERGFSEAASTEPLSDYIFDPDAALIRAAVLGEFCDLLGLHRISNADSYLTGDGSATHRGASCYRVIHAMPYKARPLSTWLLERGIGRLVIKKRHFPREPAELEKELRLPGTGQTATLILIRQDQGGHLAVICEPLNNDANI